MLQCQIKVQNRRNLFLKDKNDINKRNRFIESKSNYNKIKKKQKHKYNQLSTLSQTQPSQFWRIIKTQYTNKDKNSETLQCNDLYDHFKSLYATDINIDGNELQMDENQ